MMTILVLWASCPNIWQQQRIILNLTSVDYIPLPQKDYTKETWVEPGSGLT